MLSYEGIFFEADMVDLIHSLETEQLAKVNDKIHCTFRYHPSEEEIFNEIVGKSFEILLIGYENNGANSIFQVQLPDELIPYYINYDDQNPDILIVPHITASLSEGTKAFNHQKMEFKPLEKPIKIVGKFGYWIKEENDEYLSYNPFYINKNI